MMPVTNAKLVLLELLTTLPQIDVRTTMLFLTALVTRNTVLSQEHASNAQLDRPVIMPKRDAKFKYKTVTTTIRSNWAKIDVMLAVFVQLDKPSTGSRTDAIMQLLLDHNVHATNNSMQPLTDVTTAHLVNCLETINSTKMEDAPWPLKIAITSTRSN
jgi:hypothetical protein